VVFTDAHEEVCGFWSTTGVHQIFRLVLLGELENLAALIGHQVGVQGSFTEHELAQFNLVQYSVCKRWVVDDNIIFDFLHGQ